MVSTTALEAYPAAKSPGLFTMVQLVRAPKEIQKDISAEPKAYSPE
jgi:hypothetical protein